MEELLRYSLTRITIKLLVFELVVFFICLAAILLVRWDSDRKKRKIKLIEESLSKKIMTVFLGKTPLKEFKLPKEIQDYRLIIETLENFETRISDSSWKEIKNHICDHYLLPEVDNYTSNRSWVKRQLGARCLLLRPSKANEDVILRLLNDSNYMVRIVAATCITKMDNKQLFLQVIRKMAEESKLARYPYRDALIQVNNEKFLWIQELLETKPETKLAALCMDLLSTRTSKDLFSLVVPYLYEDSKECQVEAIKILKNIPTEDSFEILNLALHNNDWKVRVEAIKALAALKVKRAIPKIQRRLNDQEWVVRLQAAIALKSFGTEGVNILSQTDQNTEPKAFEVSQYVLALPEPHVNY